MHLALSLLLFLFFVIDVYLLFQGSLDKDIEILTEYRYRINTKGRQTALIDSPGTLIHPLHKRFNLSMKRRKDRQGGKGRKKGKIDGIDNGVLREGTASL